jgi:hypothetical protein
MRLIGLCSIPLTFIMLLGCAKHDVRCDSHLAPINQPEPPATSQPTERGLP